MPAARAKPTKLSHSCVLAFLSKVAMATLSPVRAPSRLRSHWPKPTRFLARPLSEVSPSARGSSLSAAHSQAWLPHQLPFSFRSLEALHVRMGATWSLAQVKDYLDSWTVIVGRRFGS